MMKIKILLLVLGEEIGFLDKYGVLILSGYFNSKGELIFSNVLFIM